MAASAGTHQLRQQSAQTNYRALSSDAAHTLSAIHRSGTASGRVQESEPLARPLGNTAPVSNLGAVSGWHGLALKLVIVLEVSTEDIGCGLLRQEKEIDGNLRLGDLVSAV